VNAAARPRRALAALLVAGAAASPLRAEPLDYQLDPTHTFVHFEVLHFGTSTLRGRIGPVTGDVQLDREAGRGEMSLRIPVGTVSTGLRVFDARLREPDLLATEAWPEAYFVATRLRFADGQPAEIRGEFTLRGVSQPLSLRTLHFACRTDGTGAGAGEVCGGDFEAELLRSEFGVTFGLPFIGNRVLLRIQAEGRRR
jgi:polyisoprenoid-binding protein YceI